MGEGGKGGGGGVGGVSKCGALIYVYLAIWLEFCLRVETEILFSDCHF